MLCCAVRYCAVLIGPRLAESGCVSQCALSTVVVTDGGCWLLSGYRCGRCECTGRRYECTGRRYEYTDRRCECADRCLLGHCSLSR